MIQVQERAKEEPQTHKISTCELWVSARFDDLHKLLSREPRMGYVVNQFLTARPPQQKFIDKFQNVDATWADLFPHNCPWDYHYTLFILNGCVEKYKKGDPEFEWVAAFGERHHAHIVDLVEELSRPLMAATPDWPFCFHLVVQILDSLLCRGLSIHYNSYTRFPQFLE
jgi:hypothetical protein